MDDSARYEISKIEAAKRQLDCAIELWFLGKDDISIHTLLAAAYQVIHDVNIRRGTTHDALYAGSVVKPEYRKQWSRMIKEASNFFKHADKDPEGQIEFFPISNIMFMLYAITGLAALMEQSSPNLRILSIWLYLHEPRFLSSVGLEFFKNSISVDDVAKLRPLLKQEFFETLSKAAVDFHAGANP